MNRLEAELRRLYLSPDAEPPHTGVAAPGVAGLVGAGERVRVLVLAVARPAPWDPLSRVWQGVQADLELPAPAIAVSGGDAYQLWFSLAQPVPVAQAATFLEALRRRYLAGVAPERIAMTPAATMPAGQAPYVAALPPVEVAPDRWSAFVKPDLAALFAEESWLDLPPSPEAQAELLARLQCTQPDDWARALQRLKPVAAPVSVAAPAASLNHGGSDPRGFLLATMNDSGVEMHLRIAAAAALLPYFEPPRSP
jgi:hypothetical protein